MSDTAQPARGPKAQPLIYLREATFVNSTTWPRVAPPEGYELDSVVELSDGELDEALRPVILVGGQEYTVESTLSPFLKQLRAPDVERHTSSHTALPRAKSERLDPSSLAGGTRATGVLNGQYINFFMDAWFGDSGSGLYVYDTDGWPYLVGVLRGASGAIGDDTRPNFGRRMTQDVFDFVVEYSAL